MVEISLLIAGLGHRSLLIVGHVDQRRKWSSSHGWKMKTGLCNSCGFCSNFLLAGSCSVLEDDSTGQT